MTSDNDANGVFFTEERGDVLVMTINRPDKRNAINAEVFAGMVEAFSHLDGSAHLRVGVLTGAGGYFSSGMDLRAFAEGESMGAAIEVLSGQAGPRKPLIAAIEGFAIAGGLETALVCDLLVAASDARFGFPEVKRGIFAAGGGLIKLAKRVPYHRLMELALVGDYVPAEDAERLGLLSRVTEPSHALDVAIELAEKIAANAPLALDATKTMVQHGVDDSSEELWRLQNEIIGPVTGSSDAMEGSRAFLERRTPIWQGT